MLDFGGWSARTGAGRETCGGGVAPWGGGRMSGGNAAGDVPAARPTPQTAMPFLVLSVMGLLVVLLPPYDTKLVHLLVAGVMTAVLARAYLTSLRRPERSWIDVAAPLGSFPLILVLRDAT